MNVPFAAYRKFYALDEAFAWLRIHVANVSLLDTVDSVIRIPTLKAPCKRNGWAILFADGKVLCGNEELPNRKALVCPANPFSTRPEFALPSVGDESVALEVADLSDDKLRIGPTSNAVKNQNRCRKESFHISRPDHTSMNVARKSYPILFTKIWSAIEFNPKIMGRHSS